MVGNILDSSKFDDLEDFLNDVSEAILKDSCSLFVGAGSSRQYGFDDWNALVIKAPHGNNELSDVTQKAGYASLKDGRFKTAIQKILEETGIDTNNTHTYLYYILNFDFNTIWTTNYDQVIEKVLETKHHPYLSIYNYARFDQISYSSNNVIYKINGSIEESDSIVITNNDFIDYKRTHSAFIILLKRELICRSFLFIGCSFDDDILRTCLKDIQICFSESGVKSGIIPNHYAIIADKDPKLDFITKDMANNYGLHCLKTSKVEKAYIITEGISAYVKFDTIFISGAYRFESGTDEEENAKLFCRKLTNCFQNTNTRPYKIITGLGNSIGHFISGSIKERCRNNQNKNINRYLQMEPFPFTGAEDSARHRYKMIEKAGITIFIYGNAPKNANIEQTGMYKEYLIAKENKDTIIIPIPCGTNTVSDYIFNKEKECEGSFSSLFYHYLKSFDLKKLENSFFDDLYKKVNDISSSLLRSKTKDIFDFLNE